MTDFPIPVDSVVATRIGVLADSHCRADDASDFPSEVEKAFEGVDLIVHCGDIGKLALLDRLERIAPVLATRSSGDGRTAGNRLAEATRVIECGGKSIGVIFNLKLHGAPVSLDDTVVGSAIEFAAPMDEVLQSRFGRRVDIVLFGGLHWPLVATHEGVLFVNPGSPTLPRERSGPDELGTVAIVDLVSTPKAEVVKVLRPRAGAA